MRYQATASISWIIDTDLSREEVMKIANSHLNEFFIKENLPDPKVIINLNKLKDKIEKIRLGEFSLQDVMPYFGDDAPPKEFECDGVTYKVRMNSQRYITFQNCMECVSCGLKIEKMFLECHPAETPIFNLYGKEDEKLVLMTKDHILAKAFGGQDTHDNFQTMCSICNGLKGHANLSLESVSKLRKIYDENKNSMSKRSLYLLIDSTKAKLQESWPDIEISGRKKLRKTEKPYEISKNFVFTICDVGLYVGKDKEVYGISASEDSNEKIIGIIKKGVYLEPLVEIKDKITCKTRDEEIVTLNLSLVKKVL